VFHSARLGKTRYLLITQQHHRPLYGSHLQSIMSPRFYSQYASNFNTLASIFVCSPAFLFVFPLTLALSASRFKEIIFYSASSRSADTPRENFVICISCEEGGSCIASKSVRSSTMYSLNQEISNYFTFPTR